MYEINIVKTHYRVKENFTNCSEIADEEIKLFKTVKGQFAQHIFNVFMYL